MNLNAKGLKVLLTGFVAALLIGIVPSMARATTLTFDDYTTADSAFITTPYGGLTWSNFGVANGTHFPQTGYYAGRVSGDYVAYNAFGTSASVSNGTFTFNDAYFTGAWNDGLIVTVQGLNGASVLFTTTFTVSATAPTLETFNWSGINRLNFSSAGGTHHAGYNGFGTQFAMDNFRFNEAVATPEPASVTLLALGALGLAGYGLRRRKKVVALAAC